PAGTISQIARGFVSAFANSAREAVPTAFSFTSSATAFEDMSKTAQSWPPLKSRRTMFAPIRPRPIIPSCKRQPSFKKRCLDWIRSARGAGSGRMPGLLEDIHELAIPPRDLGDRLFARHFLGPPGDQRIPENGATDRKSDEARYARRDPEPFTYLAIILAAAKDDATNLIAAAELLVHQDAGLLLRHAGDDCGLEALVDDLLGGGDLGGLCRAQRRLPAEHLGLEGTAVVERLDVQIPVISAWHQAVPFPVR